MQLIDASEHRTASQKYRTLLFMVRSFLLFSCLPNALSGGPSCENVWKKRKKWLN